LQRENNFFVKKKRRSLGEKLAPFFYTMDKKKIILLPLILCLVSSFVFGTLDVFVQDQNTNLFDFPFTCQSGKTYSLTSDAVVGTYELNLNTTFGLSSGDYIGLYQDSTDTHGVLEFIDNITGNTIYLKQPLPFNVTLSSNPVLYELCKNIAQDYNSNSTIYSIENYASRPLDITRVMFVMITDKLPDLTKFGDIAGGIDKGCLLRHKKQNGYYDNIWTYRTNLDFAATAYDFTVYDESNPSQGSNGLASRLTFSGQEKHGVVIRLYQNESLEMFCRDDLSSLVNFNIIAQGHFTDNVTRDIIGIEGKEEENMYFLLMVVLGFGLVLAIIGQYLRNWTFTFFAGSWYLLNSITIFLNYSVFDFEFGIFMLFLSAGLFWHSVLFARSIQKLKNNY